MRTRTKAPGSFNLFQRDACAVLLSMMLAACDSGGGGGSSDIAQGSEPAPAASQVEIRGQLYYEFVPSRPGCAGLDYDRIEQRPIRGATIQLVSVADGAVLDSTVAAEDGSYRLVSAPGHQVFVRVRAELKASNPAWDVSVRDNTRATERPLAERPLYVLEGSPFELSGAAAERQLMARSGWDGGFYSKPRAAAPFAILDSLYSAMNKVRQADAEADFPRLDVFWSPHNSTLLGAGSFNERMSAGQIGTSFYSPAHRSIFLLGRADEDTEEFDSHVIVHEWGHYFEQMFSRSDSPGGSHNLRDPLDKRLAFSEGWATALSGLVLESALYCDTSGPGQRQGFFIDMSESPNHRAGWFSEWSLVSLLYALGAQDAQDGFTFTELYQVLAEDHKHSPAFTSIFTFAEGLKQRYPERQLLVDQLLSRYDISGIDAYGSHESNNADSQHPDALPIYKALDADGRGLEICVNDEFDLGRSGNKLGEFAYLRLQVEHAGPYRVSVETLNPPSFRGSAGCPGGGTTVSHSDPDFQVHRRGQALAINHSCQPNYEEASLELSPGDYVMAVTEKRFGDSNTAENFPQRICFEVKAAPLF